MLSDLEGHERGHTHGQFIGHSLQTVLGNAICYPKLVQGLVAGLTARQQPDLKKKTATRQTRHRPNYRLTAGFKHVDGDQRRHPRHGKRPRDLPESMGVSLCFRRNCSKTN